jgi:multicomponent Na+:H+ antiporter subunit E
MHVPLVGEVGALRDVLGRLLVFSGLWVILVDLDLRSPFIAGVVILAAAATSLALSPPTRRRWRVRGALRFIPYFVRVSLAGGVDVALRALRPSLPIAPDLMRVRLRLDGQSAAATFLIDVLSLLPGTLCAEVNEQELTIHVIDRERTDQAQLRELEERVAAIFGEPLPGPEHAP